MRVAVIGGTGELGAPLVAALAANGDEALAVSRKPTAGMPAGASHRPADLISGDGLAEAVAGADAVVDASNSLREAGEVLVAGTRRLLRAEAEAGVRHHIGISIVGCDRVPLAYYRAKVEQEEAIAAGEVPWSLLRATQFHQLIAGGFEKAARARVLPTGRARLQPIDATVVATRLAEAVHAEPGGRLADVAGPEVQTLTELARNWRRARGRALLPVRIPTVGRIGGPLREGALCDPAAATPGASFGRWLDG